MSGVKRQEHPAESDAEPDIQITGTRPSKPPKDKSKGGAPPNELLNKIVSKSNDQGHKSWSCIACGIKYAGNAQFGRAIRHAKDCQKLQENHPELWSQVLEAGSNASLGAQIEASDKAVDSASRSEPQPKKARIIGFDLDQMRQKGKEKQKTHWENYQKKIDHIIMRLITVRGLVPNILDSPDIQMRTNV